MPKTVRGLLIFDIQPQFSRFGGGQKSSKGYQKYIGLETVLFYMQIQ